MIKNNKAVIPPKAGPLLFFLSKLMSIQLHGGFFFIQQSYNYPLIRPIGHIKTWGQRESVAKARLKHRYPLSTAQNVTWGLFCSRERRVHNLVIGYKSQAWKPGVFT